MHIEDNVLVARFHSADVFDEVDEINETFFELLQMTRVDAHVACLEMERAAGEKMLEGAQKAAKEGKEHGLEKWGIVGEGIGAWAVKSKVDLPELEVEEFEDTDEALTWAQS